MASNANVNKVVYGQSVLVDLTGDTVAADKLLSGIVAHDKSGAQVTGSIPGKAAQTYTPGVSAQTIAAGQYLAGAQTIQGDANLTAANIAEGVSIFGVTGTHSGGGGGGGGGGGAYAPNDVNFFDYDGTIVYSCSAADFANLAAMPANPSHTNIGLTAQGWNWTLERAKIYVAAYGILDIGQMYVPTDGKTHIYLAIGADRPASCRVFDLRFQASASQGVKIDWGDGSAIETSSGTTAKTYTHTYAASGDYEVKLEVASGTMTFPGTNASGAGYSLYGDRSSGRARNITSMIQKIFFGSGIQTIGDYGLWYCSHIAEVIIPRGVTALGACLFSDNYSLKYCTIPDTVTNLCDEAFRNCHNLRYVSLPRSMTTINNSEFYNCYGLLRIAIPDSVTTMGDYTLNATQSAEKIILPNTITSIGPGVVYKSLSLRELTLPVNLSGELGAYMFGYCNNLKHIDIPSGITGIGQQAFANNWSLVSITIPPSVTTMGNRTFAYSFGLTEIHLQPTTPPTLGSSVLFNCPSDCTIYVPYSADHSVLNAYKTATNWSAFASRMVEEPQ